MSKKQSAKAEFAIALVHVKAAKAAIPMNLQYVIGSAFEFDFSVNLRITNVAVAMHPVNFGDNQFSSGRGQRAERVESESKVLTSLLAAVSA
jgi:hypothetical protein